MCVWPCVQRSRTLSKEFRRDSPLKMILHPHCSHGTKAHNYGEPQPLRFENTAIRICIGPVPVRHIRAFETTHPIAIKSSSVVRKRMYLTGHKDL
ncbi:hypothetical protein TNIN_244871 [Trichonephila inaurata madagascariensis]|uniref:Uncharacterized protein n=1 Tax=Trichonephila inaurata madagascariensis TaxID=2747483 RepID=A0A8X6Y3G9_9ARAC|nr:hypothetical protein TNIN_244871 [Trichonephila inaurata madagascariensis]